MGYQPNPFTNPKQRGVDLPPGCKDLLDVLKFGESDQPAAGRPTISYGPLSEIPHRVETFLESGTDQQFFSAGLPKRDIFLILVKRREDLVLNFCVPANQHPVKAVVCRIFQNPKFDKNLGGIEYVSVALNPANDSVASMLMDLLMEGFDVLEGEKLMFVSYRPADTNSDT